MGKAKAEIRVSAIMIQSQNRIGERRDARQWSFPHLDGRDSERQTRISRIDAEEPHAKLAMTAKTQAAKVGRSPVVDSPFGGLFFSAILN